MRKLDPWADVEEQRGQHSQDFEGCQDFPNTMKRCGRIGDRHRCDNG